MFADPPEPHPSHPQIYQLPDAPPPPKLPPPPPLSLSLEPPPEYEPPPYDPPPYEPPPDHPPVRPGPGDARPSLSIVKNEAMRPAMTATASDPTMNHASRPIRPPVASDPNS